MKILSESQIIEIKKRVNAARPGPWKSFVEDRDHQSGSNFIMIGEGDSRSTDIELTGASTADQDFIAHAREDIPLLIAEIERLRNKNG